jgi:hypothetical protein
VIDTLKLYLTEYSISAHCGLTVQPSPIDMSTGEAVGNFPLWRVNGRTVEGAKAYCNAERFNLSISPMSHQQPDAIAAVVQFSIPKVAGGNNYAPASRRAASAAIKSIERDLKDAGVRTDLRAALVSRVDTFRNVVADEPFSSYQPVFQLLSGKRMPKRDYGTTFLWANTQQEICVYDKLEEMALHKLNTKGFPSNTIRFEHRLLKAKKVQTALDGIRTVRDLFDGYDVLQANFQKSMQSQLFRYDVGQVETITAGMLEDDMRYFAENYKERWFSQYLRTFGLYHLLQRTQIETVRRVIDNFSSDRKKAWRVAKEMEELQMQTMKMKTVAPSVRPLSELYNELRVKVLNEPLQMVA